MRLEPLLRGGWRRRQLVLQLIEYEFVVATCSNKQCGTTNQSARGGVAIVSNLTHIMVHLPGLREASFFKIQYVSESGLGANSSSKGNHKLHVPQNIRHCHASKPSDSLYWCCLLPHVHIMDSIINLQRETFNLSLFKKEDFQQCHFFHFIEFKFSFCGLYSRLRVAYFFNIGLHIYIYIINCAQCARAGY